MKNVIVTGASGFIGQTLVAELRTRFPDANVVPVSSKVVDLADEHALFAWLDAQLHHAVTHVVCEFYILLNAESKPDSITFAG